MINDAFKSLGRGKDVTADDVNKFIKAIDKNSDGKIAKAELFEILKQLINSSTWLTQSLSIINLLISFVSKFRLIIFTLIFILAIYYSIFRDAYPCILLLWGFQFQNRKINKKIVFSCSKRCRLSKIIRFKLYYKLVKLPSQPTTNQSEQNPNSIIQIKPQSSQ